MSLKVDEAHLSDGEVPITWKILEKNDGGVIQIIYAGGTQVQIAGSGVIEGQAFIKQTKDLDSKTSGKLPFNLRSLWFMGVFIFLPNLHWPQAFATFRFPPFSIHGQGIQGVDHRFRSGTHHI